MSTSMRAVVFILVLAVFAGAAVGASNPCDQIITTLNGIAGDVTITFRTRAPPVAPGYRYWVSGKSSSTLVVHQVSSIHVHKWTRPVTGAKPEYITYSELGGLTPGTTYHYDVTDDITAAAPVYSSIYQFKTLATASSSYNVALFGDLGAYGYGLSSYTGSISTWATAGKIDLTLHFGDLAYNLYSASGTIGDTFFKNMAPILSAAPYVAGVGNHEYHGTNGMAMPYFQNWLYGQNYLGSNSKSPNASISFSFTQGLVHYVMYNTEHFCEDQNLAHMDSQYTWMQTDLAAAHAAGLWIIVMGHRYLYNGYSQEVDNLVLRHGIQCTSSGTCPTPLAPCMSGVNCKYSYEALFNTYKVTVVFGGHDHVYHRHYPMSNTGDFEVHPNPNLIINPKSPVYVITGAPGVENVAKRKREKRAATTAPMKQGYPGILTSETHSWTWMSVSTNKLSFQQVNVTDGTIIESWAIERNVVAGAAPVIEAFQPRMDPPVLGPCGQ